MKVAIIGSRNIKDNEEYWYDKICEKIPRNCTEIVSGGAKGIDVLAHRYAREHGIMFKAFLPEYKKYGKSAALIRNTRIAEYANIALAFWDGKSKGTADTVMKFYKSNKTVKIFFLDSHDPF